MLSTRARGAACGLAAAALFGLSAPLAKLLLPGVGILPLAGLLYLGGGLGLMILGAVAGRAGLTPSAREAALRRADVPALAGITLAGGVLGPVLLLVGLERLPALTASLLLNLEGPLTILLAVALFREHLGRRELVAAALVFVGAATLGVAPGEAHADWLGVAAVAMACLCWAVDNNLTQRLSLRDPIAVVRVKAFGAGVCTTAIAVASGQPLPELRLGLAALVVGAGSYGLSIVLDAYALRLVGAAREAAYFATAPFVGALAAVPLLGERLGAADLAGALCMAAGVGALLSERHQHRHVHEPLEHDHLHVHHEHHRHEHPASADVREPHSHPHRHEWLEHEHPHVSDLHHRHRHP